ncbi:hypothetical protein [Morganella morganii]|uniref:hypothetical protein n=1 Tax=Morganella morganii TaxID=582 RepID=UPI002FDAD180
MSRLSAKQFNKRYPVGSYFIYQPNRILRGGPPARTLSRAKDENDRTIVEIDIEPYYTDIDSLNC